MNRNKTSGKKFIYHDSLQVKIDKCILDPPHQSGLVSQLVDCCDILQTLDWDQQSLSSLVLEKWEVEHYCCLHSSM